MTDNLILEEYKLCTHEMEHIDKQHWNWGAFLFGGSLVATGFVLSQKVGWIRLLGLSLVSSVLLIGYILYVSRGTRIKDILAARMRQIEHYHLGVVWTERRIFLTYMSVT